MSGNSETANVPSADGGLIFRGNGHDAAGVRVARGARPRISGDDGGGDDAGDNDVDHDNSGDDYNCRMELDASALREKTMDRMTMPGSIYRLL